MSGGKVVDVAISRRRSAPFSDRSKVLSFKSPRILRRRGAAPCIARHGTTLPHLDQQCAQSGSGGSPRTFCPDDARPQVGGGLYQ